MAFWTAWVFICFAMMTMHTAALPRNYLGGSFQPEPDSKMLWAAPDQQWLALIHELSKGSLAAYDTLPDKKGTRPRVFDPNGEFIIRYAARRAEFETKPGIRVRREWGKSAENAE
jgi:hypothetical protein